MSLDAGNAIATPRGRARSSSSTVDDNSPSNSTLTDFATNAAAASLRTLGGVETLRTKGGGYGGTASNGGMMIRADPSLLTCFDAGDKELYELWARRG